jgi:hypothetical protein
MTLKILQSLYGKSHAKFDKMNHQLYNHMILNNLIL